MRSFTIVASLWFACASTANAASTMTIRDAWSRPASDTGVIYMTLTNPSDRSDRLIGASTSIAAHTEMHESMETHELSGMTMGGVVSMHPVSSIAIPPHTSLRIAPGGYHFMLIGLHRPLRAGERFGLRLHFVRAGWLPITVSVRPLE